VNEDYKRIRWKQLLRKKNGAEPNLKAHLLLLMIGVGDIIDGIVLLLSLGFVSGGFALEAARQMGIYRMELRNKQ
jgi:hypothetical protein